MPLYFFLNLNEPTSDIKSPEPSRDIKPQAYAAWHVFMSSPVELAIVNPAARHNNGLVLVAVACKKILRGLPCQKPFHIYSDGKLRATVLG